MKMLNVEVINKSDVRNNYGMCFSQQKPHELAAFMQLQPQAASVVVRNNNFAPPKDIHVLPTQNNPNYAHPHTNNKIRGETTSSSTETKLHSEVLKHTKVVTKEMSSSTKASNIKAVGSHILLQSTTSYSRITKTENELKHIKPFSVKAEEEKQWPTYSHPSKISSSNGSAHHAMSETRTKVTVNASTTPVSKYSASNAPSPHAKGKVKLTVYTLLLRTH
jgi:hypothetical protein